MPGSRVEIGKASYTAGLHRAFRTGRAIGYEGGHLNQRYYRRSDYQEQYEAGFRQGILERKQATRANQCS
jgi:hypothetical protein